MNTRPSPPWSQPTFPKFLCYPESVDPSSEDCGSFPPNMNSSAQPRERPELRLVTTTCHRLSSPPNEFASSPSSSLESALLLVTPSTASPTYPSHSSFEIPFRPSLQCQLDAHSPLASPSRPFPRNIAPPAKPKARMAVRPDSGYRFSPTHNDTSSRRSHSSASRRSSASDNANVRPPQSPKEACSRAKRRKMWKHALEKSVFTPLELSRMSSPHRRVIYTATLERHIERVHQQLLTMQLFPVTFEQLDTYRGLNSRTAKSMVSALQKDVSELRMKKLALERSNSAMRACLRDH